MNSDFMYPVYRFNHGERLRVVTVIEGASRTQQQFKNECDINVIMARYGETGALPAFNERVGQFVDAPDFDFQEAQLKIAEARTMFMELPSALRARFDNDPGELIKFLGDARNRPEAEKLGLVMPPPAAPGAVKVEVVNQPAAEAKAS